MSPPKDTDSLFDPSGGFRRLRSFRTARLVYDGTFIFCHRFIDKHSRTHDQMVQAARSGAQNIAEGSLDSATSKKIDVPRPSSVKVTGTKIPRARRFHRAPSRCALTDPRTKMRTPNRRHSPGLPEVQSSDGPAHSPTRQTSGRAV